MSLPRHIAVIDIGKTNAKVVLINSATQQQVAVRSTPNVVRRDGLYPHADVEMLWRFILDSLTVLHAEHKVDGISITTHGATAALMAEKPQAVPPWTAANAIGMPKLKATPKTACGITNTRLA